jgi:hypothetical protein
MLQPNTLRVRVFYLACTNRWNSTWRLAKQALRTRVNILIRWLDLSRGSRLHDFCYKPTYYEPFAARG